LRVDCIRVTHPYATLVAPLLAPLPFGLHVLGLPLAFILSQDQTLHSIFLKLRLRLDAFPFTPSVPDPFRVQHKLCHCPWSHRFSSCPGTNLSDGPDPFLESTRSNPLPNYHASAINFHLFKERSDPPEIGISSDTTSPF
jgi:hypothetical protein